MKRYYLLAGFLIASLGLVPAFSKEMAKNETAKASFINDQGQSVGEAVLTNTKQGVLIQTKLTSIPEGWHAFHVHSVGQCVPPFKTAGGHYNPHNKEHGYENPKGSHVGDLPNVYVGKDGILNSEALLRDSFIKDLLKKDGSSIVVHATKDDYKSDPAGDAGARIACGVIKQ